MSTPVTVIASFQARPGKEADLCAALTGLLAPTRKESGCLNYDLHVSADNPGRFLFHENWSSQADLDAHLKSPHLRKLLSQLGTLCADSPLVSLWQRVD
jgi:quinol monooxygenase YgiN